MRAGRIDFAVLTIIEAILQEREGDNAVALAPQVVEFVQGQHARMPDYLRTPLRLLTLALDAWPWVLGYGRPLRRLAPWEASQVLATWRTGWPAFRRDLVGYYEALTVFGAAALREDRLDD
jgi:hypothetical protein